MIWGGAVHQQREGEALQIFTRKVPRNGGDVREARKNRERAGGVLQACILLSLVCIWLALVACEA
jgi:hypothetical protein